MGGDFSLSERPSLFCPSLSFPSLLHLSSISLSLSPLSAFIITGGYGTRSSFTTTAVEHPLFLFICSLSTSFSAVDERGS